MVHWGWIVAAFVNGFIAGFVCMGLLVRADAKKTARDFAEGAQKIRDAYRV